MSFSVNSNIDDLASRILARANSLQADLEISIENHIKYAVAVDQGYTLELDWSKMSRKQKAAIFLSMRDRRKKGKARWAGKKGFKVSRSKDGIIKIIVPPAGIMAKSVRPIRKHAREVIARSGWGKEARLSIAEKALDVLVDNTPVDEGLLWKGWGVRS